MCAHVVFVRVRVYIYIYIDECISYMHICDVCACERCKDFEKTWVGQGGVGQEKGSDPATTTSYCYYYYYYHHHDDDDHYYLLRLITTAIYYYCY